LHLYPIQLRDGDARRNAFQALRDAGIGVNVHFIPVHMQPDFQRFGFKSGDFPVAEVYYARAISLPLFSSLTEEQQDQVCQKLVSALEAI
jgi:dTDP-4-amino-4,6-dideoxygalactose transaminase